MDGDVFRIILFYCDRDYDIVATCRFGDSSGNDAH